MGKPNHLCRQGCSMPPSSMVAATVLDLVLPLSTRGWPAHTFRQVADDDPACDRPSQRTDPEKERCEGQQRRGAGAKDRRQELPLEDLLQALGRPDRRLAALLDRSERRIRNTPD